ncbi:hypothetical protein [Dokdonella soli]|uniref:Uncharacterized protein n=1 Tax=Dokdonella soli TaxID=529810 RepID=A0ABP3TKZ0_9GAMM
MLRKLVLAAALVSANAFAQQNTDIAGADFSSGKADATLAALGRKAAASGNRLVITAPPEWHAKITAKVHAGGNADVVLRDGFYENVLVRVEDKSAKSASAEPEKTSKAEVEKSRAEAEKAKAEAEKSKAEAEKAKAEAEKSKAEMEKARAEAEAAKMRRDAAAAKPAPVAPPPQAAAPVAAQAPRPAAAPANTAPTVADADAIRSRFEQSLNNGRSAEGTLPVSGLQSADTIYVDGPVRAVLRREGLKPVLYWLDGDLDLRRTELKVIASNRYQVLSAIHGEGTLRREFSNEAATLQAREPAADAPARLALEKSLNDGRTISDTLEPAKLHSGDVIYSNGTAVVVVRRQGNDLSRYWLIGSLDLHQTGLQADGANKYKVLNDTVH